ncbi:hypothetical protein DWV00_09680 [Trinickia dinghuensis]|uniref:Uncharacterized protein n=1 Tax=Trinickia dinghuensis TaxID=2291023 RepID=A0A3D8K1P9_9BURK|nr:hypothetical protein DWV00_09680 [Trinickia dinghuensis]
MASCNGRRLTNIKSMADRGVKPDSAPGSFPDRKLQSLIQVNRAFGFRADSGCVRHLDVLCHSLSERQSG